MPTIQNMPATLPELRVAQALDRMGELYIFQQQFMGGRMIKGGVVSDFYLPVRSLIISVIGKYWHSESIVRVKDKLQAISLQSQGIDTIWIDEEDALRNTRYYIEEALKGISHSKLITI